MNPWPVEAETAEVHLPRPGHADLVGTQKYGLTDVRDILERASARETAARVAGGAVAKAFLARARRRGLLARDPDHRRPAPRAATTCSPADFAAVDESPVRCLDADASRAMVAEINRLRKANESLGGVFEVRAFGLRPGLGSHVSWEERLDGSLGQAILSIQAMKAVSIGDGLEVAGLPGSQAHDEIFYDEPRGFYRQTNRAGGVEGGMTTGEPLVVRGSMKPLPTLTKPLRSVDIATHEPAEALRERTDSCTVPAAGVVGEAMVAFVLADAYRRKFGGDHIDDVRAARARLRGADRVAAALSYAPSGDDRRAVAMIGFMGAGKSTAARGAARGARSAGGRRRRRASRSGWASRSRGCSPRTARPRSAPPRSGSRSSCSTPARAGSGRARARRRARSAPRAVREALADHLVVWIDVDVETRPGRAVSGSDRPLAADRARVRAPVRRARAALRARWPTSSSRTSAPRRWARSWRAADGLPAGARMLWAASASGDYPAYIGPGLLGERRFWPADRRRPALPGHRRHAGRLYGERAASRSTAASRSCPASSQRRSPTPRSSGPSWPGPG